MCPQSSPQNQNLQLVCSMHIIVKEYGRQRRNIKNVIISIFTFLVDIARIEYKLCTSCMFSICVQNTKLRVCFNKVSIFILS